MNGLETPNQSPRQEQTEAGVENRHKEPARKIYEMFLDGGILDTNGEITGRIKTLETPAERI